MNRSHRVIGVGLLALLLAAARAVAQDGDYTREDRASNLREPMALVTDGDREAEESSTTRTSSATLGSDNEYLGVSEFFNIREANPNVSAGRWEFRLPFAWTTQSDGTDDDFTTMPAIKYGITDDLFVGLEMASINLGDGGEQGNGDINLLVHWRLIPETDSLPAFALWNRTRFPSGDGSSKVDAEFHGTLTKTLAPKLRAHIDGFIMTANGQRGRLHQPDRDFTVARYYHIDEGWLDRRHFQWGIGPGFDYELTEQTLLILSYLHRSSEFYGHHNQNILEFGVNHNLSESQQVTVAVDVGLDGSDETPNFAVKAQWGIMW